MNRIRELREAHGMKQRDLANKLKCAVASVSRYELEQHQLDPPTIRTLCTLFDVTSDYLLCLSDTPEPFVTEADAQLLRAYHAAPENVRAAIDALLLPPVAAPGEEGRLIRFADYMKKK